MGKLSLNYTNKSKNKNYNKQISGWIPFFVIFGISIAIEVSIPYLKRNISEVFGSYFNEFFSWVSEVNFILIIFGVLGSILFLVQFFTNLKSNKPL